MSMSMSIVDL